MGYTKAMITSGINQAQPGMDTPPDSSNDNGKPAAIAKRRQGVLASTLDSAPSRAHAPIAHQTSQLACCKNEKSSQLAAQTSSAGIGQRSRRFFLICLKYIYSSYIYTILAVHNLFE
jgi:hypothetical protein